MISTDMEEKGREVSTARGDSLGIVGCVHLGCLAVGASYVELLQES